MTLASYGLLPGHALSVIRTPSLERVVKANSESTGGVLSAWESTFAAGVASPLHVHHDAAHAWFGRNRSRRWATCALTENAFPIQIKPELDDAFVEKGKRVKHSAQDRGAKSATATEDNVDAELL